MILSCPRTVVGNVTTLVFSDEMKGEQDGERKNATKEPEAVKESI